jgi:hypothetical protein
MTLTGKMRISNVFWPSLGGGIGRGSRGVEEWGKVSERREWDTIQYYQILSRVAGKVLWSDTIQYYASYIVYVDSSVQHISQVHHRVKWKYHPAQTPQIDARPNVLTTQSLTSFTGARWTQLTQVLDMEYLPVGTAPL